MSQGHARMTIGAEHETAAPSLMHSLSRQQDRNAGQNGWLDTVDLGTIVCIPDPVHQKDWACASVKMIFEGKCHGEVGFTIHAAQTSSKHIYVWAKRERAGLTNLINISKMASYSFPSKVLERNRSDCGTKANGNDVYINGTSLLGNWKFLKCRGMGYLLMGLQAVQIQEIGLTL